MEISEKNNIKPWQVVSLLMKYKIIKKRDEALGYDDNEIITHNVEEYIEEEYISDN